MPIPITKLFGQSTLAQVKPEGCKLLVHVRSSEGEQISSEENGKKGEVWSTSKVVVSMFVDTCGTGEGCTTRPRQAASFTVVLVSLVLSVFLTGKGESDDCGVRAG